MTALFLHRLDILQLYPPFLRKLIALLDECFEFGVVFWGISGFRTVEEQNALYAQGRATPGPIVTRARGGQSPHQYGIAVDLCRDGNVFRDGLQPDYRPESYEILRKLAPKHGLVWGGSWRLLPDMPHVQLPGFVSVADLAPLKERATAGGLPAVFSYLDGATNGPV